MNTNSICTMWCNHTNVTEKIKESVGNPLEKCTGCILHNQKLDFTRAHRIVPLVTHLEEMKVVDLREIGLQDFPQWASTVGPKVYP